MKTVLFFFVVGISFEYFGLKIDVFSAIYGLTIGVIYIAIINDFEDEKEQ